MTIQRPVVLAAAALAACLSAATARADDGDDDPVTLKQEIAGVELAPASVGTARGGLGFGATLRLGRHRWPDFYWTPVQGGFFAGGDGFDKTILVKIQTEAGWVFRSAAGALELGLGAGAGFLGMETSHSGCDGSCQVGGVGIMFSPVLRYLFLERATHTVGMFIRAEVPAGDSEKGVLQGFGMTCLIGLDLAGGWG